MGQSVPKIQPQATAGPAGRTVQKQVGPKEIPKIKPVEIPAQYMTDDSTLTPQQALEKYQAIAQDTSIPKAQRSKLIKQGVKLMQNMMQANKKLKTINYKKTYDNVTEEEAKKAEQLFIALQQQSKGAAAAVAAMDSTTHGLGSHALDYIQDKSAQALGVDLPEEQRVTTIAKKAAQLHPVTYGGTKLAGTLASLYMTDAALGGLSAYSALKGGKLPARLLARQILHAPGNIADAYLTEGEASDKLLQFVKGQLADLGFDLGAEAVSAVARELIQQRKLDKALREMYPQQMQGVTIKPGLEHTAKGAASKMWEGGYAPHPNWRQGAAPQSGGLPQLPGNVPTGQAGSALATLSPQSTPKLYPNKETAQAALGAVKAMQLEAPKARKAIWKAKDFDYPIEVISEAGELNGVKYYNVEGSQTAIPETEIEFASPTTPAETPVLRPKGWEDMQPAKAMETPLKADSGAQGAIGTRKPHEVRYGLRVNPEFDQQAYSKYKKTFDGLDG
ncbi:hypothetical protein, partial [Candidatus Darwinibacter acetoxidans]